MSYIVAIDGPAGSGKGTITKIISDKLGIVSVDTGAMYRCIALYMLENDIKLEEIDKIRGMLGSINIKLDKENVYLNDRIVTKEIRTKKVNDFVSQVSHVVEIRNGMVDLQRKMGENCNIILEGRDIGTNVFPNAEVKIYLDAAPEERAKRRYKQNIEQGINDVTYEEILANVIIRDTNDKTSSVAPLKKADDAIVIDSTNMSIDEVANKVIDLIKEKVF